jgi:hypothetical protein
MPLTEIQARNAKANNRAYKLFDSEGLFLLVQPNGTKLWRLGEDAGAFLDQFLTALPVTMNETLGPRIAEPRPRWAIGTSRLVARLLAKHIDDFAERDISLVLGR